MKAREKISPGPSSSKTGWQRQGRTSLATAPTRTRRPSLPMRHLSPAGLLHAALYVVSFSPFRFSYVSDARTRARKSCSGRISDASTTYSLIQREEKHRAGVQYASPPCGTAQEAAQRKAAHPQAFQHSRKKVFMLPGGKFPGLFHTHPQSRQGVCPFRHFCKGSFLLR